jgi:hypothetical protein
MLLTSLQVSLLTALDEVAIHAVVPKKLASTQFGVVYHLKVDRRAIGHAVVMD